MTDEKQPDFEGMSLLELLQYDYSLKKNNLGYGTAEKLDKWMQAVLDKVPFHGLHETVNYLENQLFELQAQFERLVIALDKQLDPVEVSLKEWIKR